LIESSPNLSAVSVPALKGKAMRRPISSRQKSKIGGLS
jgi:hypothetical protein